MIGWMNAVGGAIQDGACWVVTVVTTIPADALQKGAHIVKAVICGDPTS